MVAGLDPEGALGMLREGWLPMAAVLAALVFCFIFLRRGSRRARRWGAEGPDLERGAFAARASGAPRSSGDDAARVLHELKEIGREIEGRIDTRIQYLTGLLAEADRAVERLTAAVAAARDRAAGGEDPRKAEILALAREGSDPGEIAGRLRLPVGEVQLVLGLARRSAETAPQAADSGSRAG